MRFPESRSFSNRLFPHSDFFHCVFQAQAIELIHWQVAKQIDSPVKLLGYLPEVLIGFSVVALKFRRIWRGPMRDDWLAGPKRTPLLGVVADGDDKIENYIMVLVPGFGPSR